MVWNIIDYTNSNIMYGALYYGDIRKSTNGGNSFTSIPAVTMEAWETPYILDRNDPNILFILVTMNYINLPTVVIIGIQLQME